MSLPTLAVTGSTGAVGGRVARRLAQAGVEQRLLVRRLADAPNLDGAVPVEVSDYGDFGAMAEALTGVEVLFLVSFREAEDRLQQQIRTRRVHRERDAICLHLGAALRRQAVVARARKAEVA